MKVSDFFTILNARSKGFGDHKLGNIPFVTNGTDNNGILGFVTPFKSEKVFKEKGICVSSFCEATVQKPPFLPRGNGGSGLIVLLPKIAMDYSDLFFYASEINLFKWKFSFGRMVIADRLAALPLSNNLRKRPINTQLMQLVKARKPNPTTIKGKLIKQPIGLLFDVNYGQKEYENKENLEVGKTILVSSKGENKGCYGFFNIPAHYKAPLITVPRTGTIGHAFVQEINCCANSDCLILQPKENSELGLNQLYQIAYQIRSIKWKFNYGRKITPERLKKEEVGFYI